MHFSSENLRDPVRLNALLKALRLSIWTRKDAPLFGNLSLPKATEAPKTVPQPEIVVKAEPAPPTLKSPPSAPEPLQPTPEPPQLSFVFLRLTGILWIAARDEWHELSSLLGDVAFFMDGTVEAQQNFTPLYLEWPLPKIKADQSESQAIEALTGKIQTALKPADQLLLLGETVSHWLGKCPKSYDGHKHLSLPGTHQLCRDAAAKRRLWLHLSRLKTTVQA